MRTTISLIALSVLVVFIPVVVGQTVEKVADSVSVNQQQPVDSAETAQPSLIGEWLLVQSQVDSVGSLIVREDGTYTRAFPGASVTGPYVIDMTKPPYALDLCVGECGGPGSEWTTIFSIFRFHTADSLELRNSPSSERFTEFAEKPDKNTCLYVRQKAEPKKE